MNIVDSVIMSGGSWANTDADVNMFGYTEYLASAFACCLHLFGHLRNSGSLVVFVLVYLKLRANLTSCGTTRGKSFLTLVLH